MKNSVLLVANIKTLSPTVSSGTIFNTYTHNNVNKQKKEQRSRYGQKLSKQSTDFQTI